MTDSTYSFITISGKAIVVQLPGNNAEIRQAIDNLIEKIEQHITADVVNTYNEKAFEKDAIIHEARCHLAKALLYKARRIAFDVACDELEKSYTALRSIDNKAIDEKMVDWQQQLDRQTLEDHAGLSINYEEGDVLGRIMNGERSFSGQKVTLKGCRYTPMKILYHILMNMDFTVTCISDGEPSIEFKKQKKDG